MKRAIASCLLCVSMLISFMGLVAPSVFADDGTASDQTTDTSVQAPEEPLLLSSGDDLTQSTFPASMGGRIVLENNTSYMLESDVEIDGFLYVPATFRVVIDLNGYTLTRTGANSNSEDGCVVRNDGVLVIGDSTTAKDGKITGGNARYGGAIQNAGMLTIQGGIITGNVASTHGGAIYNGEDATLNFLSGTISSNIATGHDGGAIYNLGTAVIKGGLIEDNTALGNGGGIYNAGVISFSNAPVIRSNSAGGVGSGIYDAGTIQITGSPTVYGNEADNLYLEEGKTIEVKGKLSQADIGVTVEASDYITPITSGFIAAGNEEWEKNFFSLDAGQDLTLTVSAGEICAKKPSNVRVYTWAELKSAVNQSSKGQIIELGNNIMADTSDTRVEVKSGKDVTIDLAGRVINRGLFGKSSAGAKGQVIFVASGGKLTVIDSGMGGKITGGSANKGAGINIEGTVVMEGGIITGNKTVEYGGGVHISSGGKFIATSTSITNNAAGSNGGGIDCSGKMELYGCAVTNNSAKNKGGGVYKASSSTVSITNTAIDSNSCEKAAGGIGIYAGTVNMTGGSVSFNTSVDIGGILVSEDGTLDAENTRIEHNSATLHNGGGIANSLGKLYLDGCTLDSNRCLDNGGGIYTSGVSELTDCSITNNYAMDNGGGIAINNGGKLRLFGTNAITNNSCELYGGGIFVSESSGLGAFVVQDTVIVQDNSTIKVGDNVYLQSGKHVTVGAKMSTDSNIGVTTSQMNTDYSDPDSYYTDIVTAYYEDYHAGDSADDYFFSDMSAYVVYVEEDPFHLLDESERGEVGVKHPTWEGLVNEVWNAPSGSTITLQHDWTAGPEDVAIPIASGTTKTIDLNGYTLDRHRTLTARESGGAVIFVRDNATLRIIDSKGSGKIMGGSDGGVIVGTGARLEFTGGTICNNISEHGGGVEVRSTGQFKMTGGTIRDNKAYNGGGVWVKQWGGFTMEGGVIENNTAQETSKTSETYTGEGGGVWGNGTIKVYGGKICGNSADSNGGGIYNKDGNLMELSNCEITDNASGSMGGGVCIVGVAKMQLGEGAVITGNEADGEGGGVYVQGGRPIKALGNPVVRDNKSPVGSNIHLAGEQPSKIEIVGALTSTQPSMGVSIEGDTGVFTTGFSEQNPGKKAENFFFETYEACDIITNGDGEGEIKGSSTLLQEAIDDAENGATIKLERDHIAIEGEGSIVVPEFKEITIDLNGHLIDRGLPTTDVLDYADDTGHVIKVGRGAKLTITDTSEDANGKITGGVSERGGGIYSEGDVTLLAGSIESNMALFGGGIYMSPSTTLTIAGGKVCENKAGGTYDDNDGNTYENPGYGGGIYLAEDDVYRVWFDMTGGEIFDNAAYNRGGGIWAGYNSVLDLAGGSITNNMAASAEDTNGGGGIYLGGSAKMKEGFSITSNTAVARGGGIDIEGEGADLVMDGGDISNNVSNGEGGGISFDGITFWLRGGSITNNTAGTRAGAVMIDDGHHGVFRVAGSPRILDNDALCGSNIVLDHGKVIEIDPTGLDTGTVLHFSATDLPRAVTSGLSEAAIGGSIDSFFTYDGGAELVMRADELYAVAQADIWVSTWSELQNAVNSASAGTVIGLENDITAVNGDKRIKISGKDVVLELAGNKLDRGLYEMNWKGEFIEKGYSSDEGHVIAVTSGGTLTVRDSSGNLGEIRGGNAEEGGGIYSSATLSIEGGTVMVNRAKNYGGGIYSKGTLYVSGGIIQNNNAGSNGGGFDISGFAEISDAIVLNNSAGKKGGGILSNAGKKAVSLSNVSVAGNTSSIDGGGIYIMSGALSADGGNVLSNAANTGGGIFVAEDAKYTASNINISSNEALTGKGGGIYNGKGQVYLTDATLSGNVAHTDGGAIYNGKRLELTWVVIQDNLAANNGGAICLDNGGSAFFNNTVMKWNKGCNWGGAVYVGSSASELNIAGGNIIRDNKGGGDVYLRSGKKINVTGSLYGSQTNVLLEKTEGVFTTGFAAYNEGVDPATIFGSSYSYTVYAKGNEAAVRLPDSIDDSGNFVKQADRMTDYDTVHSVDWMGAVSGDRYLNEINIPYTHDSAMKEAYAWYGSSIGALLGFDKNAQTQYRYIDEQYEDGVRIVDLRLSNYYNSHTWWDEILVGSMARGLDSLGRILALGVTTIYGVTTHCMSDDGTNLYLCHGKKAIAGTFWGENHEGDQLNLKEVLRWSMEFLREHPSETLVLNFGAETPNSSTDDEVYKRLREHLKEVYVTVNPSTGKSYLYQEEGSSSPFVKPTRMPQLKECRGQIVIMEGGGDVHGLTLGAGGLKKISDGTSNVVDGDTKVEQLNKYFNTYNLRLATDANTHSGIITQPDTNSKADDIPEILYNSMRPLEIAKTVHPAVFGEGKVFDDRTGRYFGWVKMDGAVKSENEQIYMSNFFEGLQYQTITVKPTANAERDNCQEYRLLKGTDLVIPECIYDQPNDAGGMFTGWIATTDKGMSTVYQPGDDFELMQDTVFVAQWDTDPKPEATVYEVFQNADGSWEEPTLAGFKVEGAHEVIGYDHYTAVAYSTRFTVDEEERIPLGHSTSIEIQAGRAKLYVYYSRNTYDLVFHSDAAGTKVAKTEKVMWGAPLDVYADEKLDGTDAVFAGWTTAPKTDGAYWYEETIPDSWKTEDEAAAHPCVVYAFGSTDDEGNWISDTMGDTTFHLYPVLLADQIEVHLDLGSYDEVSASAEYDWYDEVKYSEDDYASTPAHMDGDQARSFTMNADEKVRMDKLDEATRDGYVLDGWYTDDGVKWDGGRGAESAYCDKDDTGQLVKLSYAEEGYWAYVMTLTARWTPAEIEVSYDKGEYGGSEPESATTSLGSVLTLPAACFSANPDYYFSGWADAQGGIHAPNEEFLFDDWTLTENGVLSFTATYKERSEHLVIFETSGGSAVLPIEARDGAQVAEPEEVPVKAGCTFAGWYLEEDGTSSAVSWPLTMGHEDITLTAHWTPNPYTLTFTAEDGSVIDTLTADFGSPIDTSSIPAPGQKEHFDFAGWEPEIPETMPFEDTSFIATWTPATYTMTFDSNNGTFAETDEKTIIISGIYGETVDIPSNPTKSANEGFDGWVLDGTDEVVQVPTRMPDTNPVYKAKYHWHQRGNSKIENRVTGYCGKPGHYDQVFYCNICGIELGRVTIEVYDYGHRWGAWTVSTPATCTEPGIETRKCDFDWNGDHIETREIAPVGHKWDTGTVTKAATCLEAGEITYTCENDPDHTYTEQIEPTGHAWGEWAVSKAATCTSGGIESRICDNDPTHIETRETDRDPDAHKWGEWTVVVPATETETGIERRVCALDANHFEERELPVAEHVHVLSEVSKVEATCTENGHITYWECDGGDNPCEHLFADADGTEEINLEDTVIKATGHVWNDPVYKWNADNSAVSAVRTCANNSNHIEQAAASTANVKERVEPSCTEPGYIVYLATFTGDVFEDQEKTVSIPAVGHVASTTEVVENEIEPTCLDAGSRDYVIYCANCGEELTRTTETIEALGHDWSEQIVEQGDTVFVTRNCTRCDATEEYSYEKEHEHTLESVPAVAATCESPGVVAHFACSSCQKLYADAEATQELTEDDVVVAPLGHEWGDPVYQWDDSAGTVRAICACQRDSAHTVSETAVVQATVTKQPTCTETGEKTLNAAFANDLFEPQSKIVEIPAAGHVPDQQAVRENRVAPTCDTAGSYDSVIYCDVCSEKLTSTHEEVAALGHVWSEWSTSTPATCEAPGVETRVCERDQDHIETREIEATGHIWDEWTVVSAPSETAEGLERRVCENDPSHIEERAIPETDHVHVLVFVETVEPTCEDVGYAAHWVCSGGDNPCERVFADEAGTQETTMKDLVIDALGHDWDAGAVAKEPTCSENGKVVYNCLREDCPVSKTEELPRADHINEWVVETVSEPTCTEPGYAWRIYRCSVCEEPMTKMFVKINALGHVWGEWNPVSDPTCTEPGIENRICANDPDHVETREIPVVADAHSWGEWTVVKEATETETGEEQRVCENDASHIESRVIPIKEHTHALVAVAAKEPSCTEVGNIAYWECSGGDNPCHALFADEAGTHEITEAETVVAATGHAWGEWTRVTDPTCSDVGVEKRVCSNDPDHVEGHEIAIVPDAHKWVKTSEVAPTCTEQGMITYTCEYSPSHVDIQYVDPIGHAWGAWTESKAAGCTEPGEEKRVCANDPDHIETRATSATGHSWGEWTVIRPATATEEGEEQRVCSHDASHIETRAIPVVDPQKPVYDNVEGDGAVWVKGSDTPLVFRFKRSADDSTTFGHFTGLKVDSNGVASSSYDASSGSVVVSLHPDYLETLAVGEHTLAASFDDGDDGLADFTIKIADDPTPGGDTPGGDTPGGDTPGGDTPGGNTPGGDEPGGDTPGGNEPGGNPSDDNGQSADGGTGGNGGNADNGQTNGGNGNAGQNGSNGTSGAADSTGANAGASRDTIQSTGDNVAVGLLVAIALSGLVAAAAIVLRRRRR